MARSSGHDNAGPFTPVGRVEPDIAALSRQINKPGLRIRAGCGRREQVVKPRGGSQATYPSAFEPSEAVTEAGDDPGNRVSEDPDLLTLFE